MNTYQQSQYAAETTTEFTDETWTYKFSIGTLHVEPQLEAELADMFDLTYKLGRHIAMDNGERGYDEFLKNEAALQIEASQRPNIISQYKGWNEEGDIVPDITIITNFQKGITVCRKTGSTFMNDELNS